jgi:hypothetical protein
MLNRYEKQEEVKIIFICECGKDLEASFFDNKDVPDEDLDDDGHDEVYCDCGRVYCVPRPQEPTLIGTVPID